MERSNNRHITEELHQVLAELQFDYLWVTAEYESPLYPGCRINIHYFNNGLAVQPCYNNDYRSRPLDMDDLVPSFVRLLDSLGMDATVTLRRQRLRALLA